MAIESKSTLKLVDDPLLFCYLYPRDYQFYKDDLIQIWESVFCIEAEKRFEELEMEQVLEFASFDTSSSRPMYKVKKWVVDILEQRHGDKFIRVSREDDEILEHSLYVSICHAVDPTVLEKLYKAKALLILHPLDSGFAQVCRHIFQRLTLVCVDLSHTDITNLPSSISKLHHLRYLNLSYTPIITLPNSLCDISDMQTLKLRGCSKLLCLPKSVRKLRNIRHLDVDVACLLDSMPPGLGDLGYLRTLPAFVVGRGNGYHITELGSLLNLRGTISILMLENISSPDEAKQAALGEKSSLEKIELNWETKEDGFLVLENLQPHRNIKELQIVGYGGDKFPDWIGNPLFSFLTTLTIHNSSKCEILPPLGKLPGLRSLHISLMNEAKLMDHRFCGRTGATEMFDTSDAELFAAFPRLEILTLNEIPELEKWVGVRDGDFPLLQRLKISACIKLEVLPDLSLFQSLHQLEIATCPILKSFTAEVLPTSLESIAIIDCPLLKELWKRYIAEDLGKHTHIPSIWIDDQQIILEPLPSKDLSQASRKYENICEIEEVVQQGEENLNNGRHEIKTQKAEDRSMLSTRESLREYCTRLLGLIHIYTWWELIQLLLLTNIVGVIGSFTFPEKLVFTAFKVQSGIVVTLFSYAATNTWRRTLVAKNHNRLWGITTAYGVFSILVHGLEVVGILYAGQVFLEKVAFPILVTLFGMTQIMPTVGNSTRLPAQPSMWASSLNNSVGPLVMIIRGLLRGVFGKSVFNSPARTLVMVIRGWLRGVFSKLVLSSYTGPLVMVIRGWLRGVFSKLVLSSYTGPVVMVLRGWLSGLLSRSVLMVPLALIITSIPLCYAPKEMISTIFKLLSCIVAAMFWLMSIISWRRTLEYKNQLKLRSTAGFLFLLSHPEASVAGAALGILLLVSTKITLWHTDGIRNRRRRTILGSMGL